MKTKLIFYLSVFTLLCTIQSCSEDQVIPALSEEQYECVDSQITATNWCSGDYICIVAGSYYKAGAKARLGGQWVGAPPCPTFRTTGDGAKWQFQAKCTCP